MRVLIAFATFIAIGGIASGLHAAAHRADVIRRASASSVVVETGEALGSGTVVGRYHEFAFVLTCHHVIEGASPIIVHRFGVGSSATIEEDSPEHDLALLVTQLDAPPLAIAAEEPDLYETIYMIGAPMGDEGSASEGIFTAREAYDGQHFYRVTGGYIEHGISGGTGVNDAGFLIGVPARREQSTTQQGLLLDRSMVLGIVKGYVGVMQ